MNPVLKRVVWLLNTVGLLIYLVWLYSMGDRQVLRAQDGIIYFLPCIPFFFVYMLLIPPKPRPKEPPKDAGENRPEKTASEPPASR